MDKYVKLQEAIQTILNSRSLSNSDKVSAITRLNSLTSYCLSDSEVEVCFETEK